MSKPRNSTPAPAEMSNVITLSSVIAAEPDQDAIAYAAYLAWEKDGKPEGRDMEYWFAAEAQLRATNGTAAPKARKNGRARAAA